MLDDLTLRRLNKRNIHDRQIDTLIGLATGLVADGKVNHDEALVLQKWLVANSAAANNPVVQNLLIRVDEMLSDQVLDEDESRDLLSVLTKLTGSNYEIGEIPKATTLPLCTPEPEILLKGKRFCFTGTFVFGKRSACEKVVIDRGATSGRITQSTDYLVIGTYVTDSWIHQSFGRKIEQAVEWREEGYPISIVSERLWIKQLDL